MIQKGNGEFLKSNSRKTHLYFVISGQNLLFICKMVRLVVYIVFIKDVVNDNGRLLNTSVCIYTNMCLQNRLKRVIIE